MVPREACGRGIIPGTIRDYHGLERKFNTIGWQKVPDLTSCYVLNVTNAGDNDVHQSDVEKFLTQYAVAGANVRYGISKYIPPNQRPDNYTGIDTLLVQQ